jgi:hypothetical protein
VRDHPYISSERIYERQGHRIVLVATPGDVLSHERAKELGLVGGGKGGTALRDVPAIDEPLLLEGLEPISSPEADARATGDTAEAAARGSVELAPSPSVTVTGPNPQDATKRRASSSRDAKFSSG